MHRISVMYMELNVQTVELSNICDIIILGRGCKKVDILV